jgi:FixJ family two-component response regulator
MPGKSGIETVKLLKEEISKSEKKDVPFIFITGYANEEAPIEADKLGAKDYILKPFDLDKLLKSVQSAIG